MSKEKLKVALLKILEKYSWEEIFVKGWSGEDILDGETYRCFISFFQNELPNFEQARHIIRAFQKLLENKQTPENTKNKIQQIFALMNPRDQNYRFSENCDCETCVSPRKTLLRLVKQKQAN